MKLTLPFLVAVLLLRPSSALDAQQSEIEIRGDGELHYNEPDGPSKGTLDLHRFNLQLADGSQFAAGQARRRSHPCRPAAR